MTVRDPAAGIRTRSASERHQKPRLLALRVLSGAAGPRTAITHGGAEGRVWRRPMAGAGVVDERDDAT